MSITRLRGDDSSFNIFMYDNEKLYTSLQGSSDLLRRTLVEVLSELHCSCTLYIMYVCETKTFRRTNKVTVVDYDTSDIGSLQCRRRPPYINTVSTTNGSIYSVSNPFQTRWIASNGTEVEGLGGIKMGTFFLVKIIEEQRLITTNPIHLWRPIYR